LVLYASPRRETAIQWRAVPVMPTPQLGDLRIMSPVKGSKFSFPAPCFGMMTIAAFALRQDRPDRMKLAVFAQKVRPAQISKGDVPDSHPLRLLKLGPLKAAHSIRAPGGDEPKSSPHSSVWAAPKSQAPFPCL